MKKYTWLWLIGAVSFLAVIGSVIPTPAFAGDDPVAQLSMSVDAGSAVVCNTVELAVKRYAVQPSVAAYVSASNTNDGGIGVVDANKHAKIAADALYDIWITKDKRYICCKPAVDGAPSTCKILLYREF